MRARACNAGPSSLGPAPRFRDPIDPVVARRLQGSPARERPPAKREHVWVTARGERIPVSQMTDAHLTNAIAYLGRLIKSAMEDLERPDDFWGPDDGSEVLDDKILLMSISRSALRHEVKRRCGNLL